MNNINIVGATENNLNNISLQIPKGKITVFTGVSGSENHRCVSTPSPPKAAAN